MVIDFGVCGLLDSNPGGIGTSGGDIKQPTQLSKNSLTKLGRTRLMTIESAKLCLLVELYFFLLAKTRTATFHDVRILVSM